MAQIKMHERTDADWDAISDANSLARAFIINSDPKRLKAAKAWAKKLAEEEKIEADAMKTVANA